MGWGPNFKHIAHWMSAWKKMGMGVLKETLRSKLCTTVHGGEFAFAYKHPALACEVNEEVGALMPKNIETKRDEVSETSK